MKIKIALFGLLFANSIIHPAYADAYHEKEEIEKLELEAEDERKEEEKGSKTDSSTSKLVQISPSIGIGTDFKRADDGKYSTKYNVKAGLKFSGEIPNACCDKNGIVNIIMGWNGEKLEIGKATVCIGRTLTIGHAPTIFKYEKSASSLLVSGQGTVPQVKFEYTSGLFRFGCAIEKPIALAVGWCNKNHSESQSNVEALAKDKSKDGKENKIECNKLDTSDNKNPAFKMNNNIPTVGLSLGVITDDCNVGLSGLVRVTDYTHGTSADKKELKHYISWGANLGMQHKIKEVTTTVQGVYVAGLGDYVSGLSAIQGDKDRKEMCAVYYTDQEKPQLSSISAWGGGGNVAYCPTDKWTLSVAASYLTTLDSSEKWQEAFDWQWNIAPNVAYKVNEHLTFSVGYNGTKEYKVQKEKSKGFVNKASASVSFSL